MNNEQSPALAQAVESMRTMQAAYDQLSGAAAAYNEGKPALAQAITSKGVLTASTDSLATMAEKVLTISQDSYIIDGGELYAKQLFGSLTTPNYWNLYEILEQLLSDGRLVNYGGILLAEYYKGYDSLALSGAGAGGAYVVSDKGVDGRFIMYTDDTTHVWDTAFDGKGNRWVAYCFANEYHDFEITDTNKSPRSIFIGRKVGNIISLTNGRCSQIVVPDGNELEDITANAYTQNFGSDLILKNLKDHTNTSPLIYRAGNVEKIYLEIDNILTDNTHPIIDAAQNSMNNLRSIIIKSNSITGYIINFQIHSAGYYSHLSDVIIICPYIHAVINPSSFNQRFDSLDALCLLDVEDCGFVWERGSGESNLKSVFFSYQTNDKTLSVSIAGNVFATVELVDIQDGWCKPLNVASCAGLTEANMYAHILQRLKQDEADCGDGVTITLGQTNLAKLTSADSVALLDSLTNTYGYTFA